jgi:hypothetical protein
MIMHGSTAFVSKWYIFYKPREAKHDETILVWVASGSAFKRLLEQYPSTGRVDYDRSRECNRRPNQYIRPYPNPADGYHSSNCHRSRFPHCDG